MTARTILETANPVTQSLDGVRSLLQWKGRAADPLPSFIELGKDESRCVLVLSNKRDSYYCVTAKACSCPSAAYRPGQSCKHMRKFFPQETAAKTVSSSEPLIQKGGFKPFSLLPSEENALREVA